MKNINILVAISNECEKGLISGIFEREEENFTLHITDTLATLDEVLQYQAIDIILLDFSFQNGALADWLSLWPLPHIVLVSAEEQERLKSMLNEETSSFLLREPTNKYLDLLPIMVRKVLINHEMKSRQNKDLRLSERRYMELVQALPDIVYYIDEEGRFQFLNDSIRYLGYDPLELIGKHFSVILEPEEVPQVSRKNVLQQFFGNETGPENAPKLFDERRTGERKTRNLIVKLKNKAGSVFLVRRIGSVTSYGEISAVGFKASTDDDKTRSSGSVGIIRDITEKVNREELLRNSLEEKTILLREVHHRVKNNLQLILSLISLHKHTTDNNYETPVLQTIETQIHSMALVHEQLYRSESISKINMQHYIEAIIESLFDMYAIGKSGIKSSVSAQDIYFKLEKAIPLGLIINELISNSYKYAFEGASDGLIQVEFNKNPDESFTLTLQDNGIGFEFSSAASDSGGTGLHLVEILVEQLGGTILYEMKNGAIISIRIPKDNE